MSLLFEKKKKKKKKNIVKGAPTNRYYLRPCYQSWSISPRAARDMGTSQCTQVQYYLLTVIISCLTLLGPPGEAWRAAAAPRGHNVRQIISKWSQGAAMDHTTSGNVFFMPKARLGTPGFVELLGRETLPSVAAHFHVQ